MPRKAKRVKEIKPAKESPKSLEMAKEPRSPSHSPFVFSKKLIFLLAIVIIILGGIYYLKDQLVVAMVNGQPITRLQLDQELEKQSGKKTLDYLITKDLILQAAQKDHIAVTDKEVSNELKTLKDNISKSGQDYQTLLSAQGLSEADLLDQIRLQKLVDKIVGKDIKVSDAEISDYINKNKDIFPKGATEQEMKNQARNQLTQQKLSSKTQEWLSSLKSSAKIFLSPLFK